MKLQNEIINVKIEFITNKKQKAGNSDRRDLLAIRR